MIKEHIREILIQSLDRHKSSGQRWQAMIMDLEFSFVAFGLVTSRIACYGLTFWSLIASICGADANLFQIKKSLLHRYRHTHQDSVRWIVVVGNIRAITCIRCTKSCLDIFEPLHPLESRHYSHTLNHVLSAQVYLKHEILYIIIWAFATNTCTVS